MDRREDQSGEGNTSQKGPSSCGTAETTSGNREAIDEAPECEDDVKQQWQHVTRFPIQDRMTDIVKKTIEAAKLERAVCLRKLRKMQYGS